ncbi:type II toxin-antitoxin system RelE family toxin [Gracilimonas mengyeensis]|uniref:mRNA interferase RelE/StbE n=1 Tax=Gracilimonas mengyeensis TaxID=1302730 RepID=A0A521B9G1_9BACT|nr:type II toxin-antitoxin system RelE/ParE family toxin [Gracilimonas mengyeensis]SMO43350.1 mRNA interferase RelE/StbE [Gracilimonas mengyeensis]
MRWEIQIERKAQKALKKISEPYKSNIIEAIDELAKNPRPSSCTKLKGVDNLWRIRISDYRVVYQIKDDRLLILIIRIGHRRDIYEGL